MQFKEVVLTEQERNNAKNVNVAWLQKWLNNHTKANLVVDGIGGTQTRIAFMNAFINKKAPAITPAELKDIATSLGDTDTIRVEAFAHVEAAGAGWFVSGLPKILFERHRFWKYCPAPLRKITWYCNPKRGGYTMDENDNGLNDSWEKLAFAVCVDPYAAIRSVSIGKFQVMGEHYKLLGYNHPIEMLWDAAQGEYSHYKMMAGYILNVAKAKTKFLKMGATPASCAPMALAYNGAAYRENKYDEKLAAYIRKARAKK